LLLHAEMEIQLIAHIITSTQTEVLKMHVALTVSNATQFIFFS